MIRIPLALAVLLAALLVLPGSAQEKQAQNDSKQQETTARPPVKASTVLRPGQFPTLEVTTPKYEWRGHPINLSLKDADLVETLRSFAKIADVNLIIDPSVQGKVTVELKGVPWDQALYTILKVHGLGLEISSNVWTTTSKRP